MSGFNWLVGGLLAGAAGLVTAALATDDSGEPLFGKKEKALGDASALNAKGLADQLNGYFLKANDLSMKCSKLDMESNDLTGSLLKLPDDGLLLKMGDLVVDKMTVKSRQWKLEALLKLKKEASALYLQYRDTFAKANGLLERRGLPVADLKAINYGGGDFTLDHSIENEEWIEEFGRLADKVNNFLEKSIEAAQTLTDGLEKIQGEPATGTMAMLPAVTA